MQEWVIDPAGWVENRDSIPLVFWDAAPVYLDPSVGKILVPVESIEETRWRRLARKAHLKELKDQHVPGCVTLRPSGDAMGATRRDKNRVTLVLRQIISSVFHLAEGTLITRGGTLAFLAVEQPSSEHKRHAEKWSDTAIYRYEFKRLAWARVP